MPSCWSVLGMSRNFGHLLCVCCPYEQFALSGNPNKGLSCLDNICQDKWDSIQGQGWFNHKLCVLQKEWNMNRTSKNHVSRAASRKQMFCTCLCAVLSHSQLCLKMAPLFRRHHGLIQCHSFNCQRPKKGFVGHAWPWCMVHPLKASNISKNFGRLWWFTKY